MYGDRCGEIDVETGELMTKLQRGKKGHKFLLFNQVRTAPAIMASLEGRKRRKEMSDD